MSGRLLDRSPALQTSKQSRHFPYLDGLRGMAALYVVFHHAYMEVKQTYEFPLLTQYLTDWLFYGQIAVDLFIVLSGYCLMMPIVMSNGHLVGGFFQYLSRRARRILPPYYAALVLSILFILLVPGMNQPNGVRWDNALPAMTPGALLSHIFLVHNLSPKYAHLINPPMWSVATEWQIYFLFPIVLLPIWQRFGNIVTIVAALSIGLAPHFLFNKGNTACTWFIGLFAFGMVAATINLSSLNSPKKILRWSSVLGIGAMTGLISIAYSNGDWLWDNIYFMDTLAGFSFACFLVYCTNYCLNFDQSYHPTILKIMASRYAVLLGSFSYSLYLVHFPVLSLLQRWVAPLGFSLPVAFTFFLVIGTIASLAVSYLFHILIERRFMRKPVK